MGVSRETLYSILKGEQVITDKTRRKLEIAESQILTNDARGVAENPATYRQVQIQSQHSLPPRTPTEQELVNEFCRIVASAQHIPGALWEIRRVLKIHLSPDQLEKLKD